MNIFFALAGSKLFTIIFTFENYFDNLLYLRSLPLSLLVFISYKVKTQSKDWLNSFKMLMRRIQKKKAPAKKMEIMIVDVFKILTKK